MRPAARHLYRALGLCLLATVVAMVDANPLDAQVGGDGTASLGGGSDIRSGTLIPLATGTVVPAIHRVTADNPSSAPVDVEFRADAPPGLVITPEVERATIPPGGEVRVPFGIEVAGSLAPGDHPVTVELVRSDIVAVPGAVTNVPAVGSTFTVRTGGEPAVVTVHAVGAETGRPVEGQLSLAYLAPRSKPFEVARRQGSELRSTVAAGDYEAAYWLGGRKLASETLSVAAGDSRAVTLEVNSVSFVSVGAAPEEEDGRVVVADLRASVQNHLGPIDGDLTLRARVLRDGVQIDDVVLEELVGLPTDVTEAATTYRPTGGFAPGEYRFEFELISAEFTVQHSVRPTFTVPAPFPMALAAAIGAAAVLAAAVVLWWLRRRRNRRFPDRRSSDPGRPVDRSPVGVSG